MNTKLTPAHRELLARVVQLTVDERHLFIRDRDGAILLELDTTRFHSSKEDLTFLEAVCITVNEADALRAECRRLEAALREVCHDMALETRMSGDEQFEEAAAKLIRDYTATADETIAREDAGHV